MRIQDIIRRPLITEKSTELRDVNNIVAFEVDRRANKIQVKKAVETQFKVKVSEYTSSALEKIEAAGGQILEPE